MLYGVAATCAALQDLKFLISERYISDGVIAHRKMGRKPDLSQETITRIQTLHKADYSTKEIEDATGVSSRSVRRWVKKCRECPDELTPTHAKRPGKARKVSERTLNVIKRQLTSHPTNTARDIKQSNTDLLQNVSLRSVSRYIHDELDLPSRRAARKPLLTVRHKKNRVTFAKKCLSWPQDKIRSILWSDESTFTVTGTPYRYVRRPRGADRYDPLYTVKSVKHPPSLMVWGAFSYHGVGKLVFFEKGVRVNTEKYLDLLFDNLEDCFDTCHASVFMQDGAPCHTSYPVKEWLDNCAIEYIRDWPANSPDLNPIENLWSIVKKELREKDTSTVLKLRSAITSVWENLSEEVIHKLVDSVPQRLQECIKKKGNTTKY